MITNGSELRGTVVLVRPDLEIDPLDKKNHVGVICEANLDFDHIYVDFADRTVIFSAEDLLTFLHQDDILQNLRQLPASTSPEVSKALWKVDSFLGYHKVDWKIDAMRVASDHPAIQPLCVERLKNQISQNINYQYFR